MKNFTPYWILSNGHLQTCIAALLKHPSYTTETKHIKLEDGDDLELHCLPTTDPTAPILLLLHGLEGSVYSHYIQSMLHLAKQHHWRVIVMHLRGCQERVNTIPQGYHAGKTDDLSITLDYIHKTFPNAKKVFAVGYSLGGNILLKFLGENPQQHLIDAAIGVSVPFDLAATTLYLHKGIRKYYEYRFLRTLKKMTARKIDLGLNMPVNKSELYKIKTLYDFDDKITAPVHGFKDADDYYQQSSCKQFLSAIQTPTMIIHAIDDPFIPSKVIPHLKDISPQVILNIQPHGGHVGFISKSPESGFYHWLDDCIFQYFSKFIKH